MWQTVTEAVYQAEGNPAFDKPVPFSEIHLCGNCRRRRSTAPAKKVLTSQFGSWGDIQQDSTGGRWLCLPCAWTYRSPDLRRRSTVVHLDGTMNRPGIPALREILSAPIPADVAVIVPLSGKRIVAPRARWGQVVFDAGALQWRPRHKRLMHHATRLRELGFTETDLKADSPNHAVLTSLPVETHAEVRSMWREMHPLRDDKSLFPLFLLLSRKVTP